MQEKNLYILTNLYKYAINSYYSLINPFFTKIIGVNKKRWRIEMLEKGLFCALGTPLDGEGAIIKDSLIAHIESQINAGVAGLLLMGSMGMLGCIRGDQYEEIVKIAVSAVKGRVPLMVGAADNSLARIRDRLNILNKYDVKVVVTAPYYFELSRDMALTCFRMVSAGTRHDVYLYDHPYTARYKITYEDVLLLSEIPNIRGIKTGDPILIRALVDSEELKPDFVPIFSNSDLFGMGWAYGVRHMLDGIFACFPRSVKIIGDALAAGDLETAKRALNAMMKARDRMDAVHDSRMFTQAMNILGFPGNFAPDYEPGADDKDILLMREILTDLGEI
jgi:4-hydroxy-tetrahydrodipicolinate synthase